MMNPNTPFPHDPIMDRLFTMSLDEMKAFFELVAEFQRDNPELDHMAASIAAMTWITEIEPIAAMEDLDYIDRLIGPG